MHLKLDEDQKRFVDETSAISGIQKEVIREVFEFMLIRWVEQIAANPEKLNILEVPFAGKLGVRYEGDAITDSGAVTTKVTAFFDPSQQFKKIIGDIIDEKDGVVIELLKRKIENALSTLSIPDTN